MRLVKMENVWLKTTLVHPEPRLCGAVELLTGLLFTVRADQEPVSMMLEVSAPLIQLCLALSDSA